ncbi:hypothetical protein [Methanobrevibacter cuticularis]|nr:hypothetical protein [Methanobrevibacter cuticularis]
MKLLLHIRLRKIEGLRNVKADKALYIGSALNDINAPIMTTNLFSS